MIGIDPYNAINLNYALKTLGMDVLTTRPNVARCDIMILNYAVIFLTLAQVVE